MKEISDINIQRMDNGAHFTFVSNILARAQADAAVKEKASELVSNFKAAVTAEDEALKISQKSLLTDDIAKADNDRDALYAGYKKAVEGFFAIPVTDMAQAAKVLSQHIKDYKKHRRTTRQGDRSSGQLHHRPRRQVLGTSHHARLDGIRNQPEGSQRASKNSHPAAHQREDGHNHRSIEDRPHSQRRCISRIGEDGECPRPGLWREGLHLIHRLRKYGNHSLQA